MDEFLQAFFSTLYPYVNHQFPEWWLKAWVVIAVVSAMPFIIMGIMNEKPLPPPPDISEDEEDK